ncbi:hypothetical protein V8C34DRAFT_278324 [Trichoderma compactum]
MCKAGIAASFSLLIRRLVGTRIFPVVQSTDHPRQPPLCIPALLVLLFGGTVKALRIKVLVLGLLARSPVPGLRIKLMR